MAGGCLFARQNKCVVENADRHLGFRAVTAELPDTPCMLVDLAVLRRNIARMQNHCDLLGLSFRPHIKAHKVPEIARMQLDAGGKGINCQKLGEAEVMADAGINDILITYNIVGRRKIARLRKLFARIARLSVTVDSEIVASGLAGWPGRLEVLVECDTGQGRCGVGSPAAAAELAAFVGRQSGLAFAGLLTFPGEGCTGRAAQFLAEAKRLCESAGMPCPVVSTGGSPDWRKAGEYKSANEYRAGTYVYNDRSQIDFGACGIEDCAATVLSTVVSVRGDGRAVIDAGAKILTSDLHRCEGYGESPDRPDAKLVTLNEEHGYLRYDPSAGDLRVGQTLRIVPNHIWAVSNKVDEVWLMEDGKPPVSVAVSARGKVC